MATRAQSDINVRLVSTHSKRSGWHTDSVEVVGVGDGSSIAASTLVMGGRIHHGVKGPALKGCHRTSVMGRRSGQGSPWTCVLQGEKGALWMSWLGGRDLNPDNRVQSAVSYR